MFSVIIPLYNKEQSIVKTIQSVLAQTFQEFEIVVVNDGSTDNSIERVKEFDDPRIRVINKPNGGVSSARNRGIKEASFDWIALLDGDDLWESEHLSTLKKMIELYPNDKVFTTSFKRSNQIVQTSLIENIEVIEDYFDKVIIEPITCSISICVNSDVFNRVGLFDINLNRGEDLDVWARIGREYRYIRTNKVTSIYNIDAENRSNLSFDIKKSRLYNYDFSSATTTSEVKYYKAQLISSMRSFIKRGRFRLLREMKRKHKKYITWWDIIRY